MSTALAKINARVKQLAKKHPHAKRVSLQKQAGCEYRAGKLGGVKRKTVKKKSVGRARVKRFKGRCRVGASVAPHKDANDNKRTEIIIGSVSSHVSATRKALVRDIARAETRKLLAKKAAEKKKIQKRISEDKAFLRKIS